MIFFLNLDGTMTREDTGRIFQGSTAVPDIKVLSAVSSATGSLSVAFTLPSGLTTLYYPLAIVGEHTYDNGFKTYVWGIKQETLAEHGINEKVATLIGNVTQEVGDVGVTIRQTNVVTGADVASYTATFTVEYSALPTPPSTMQVSEISTLLSLLNAYYSQNADDIRTLKERVETLENKDVLADIKNINTDAGGTQGLKISDTGISWDNAFKFFDANGNQTASGTIKQNVPITEGHGINFVPDQQDGVVRVELDLEPFPHNTDGSCYVLAPNGYDSPGAYEALTVVKTSNLTYDVRVGGKTAGTITIPQDTYLDDVKYNPETKELKFTYNTSSGKEEIVIPLSDLEDVNNLLIATNRSEFDGFLVNANVGKAISYNRDLYIVISGNGIEAKKIVNLDDIRQVDNGYGNIEQAHVNSDGITWNGTTAYGDSHTNEAVIETLHKVPIVAGKNVTFTSDLTKITINADSATQLYETAVDSEGDEAPETINPSDVYGTYPAKMYDGQRDAEVGDLLIYKCDVPNSKGQYLILCKITSIDNRSYANLSPICFIQGANGTGGGGGGGVITSFYIGDAIEELEIDTNGKGINVTYQDAEIEYNHGESYNYFPVDITIPIVAGENVTLEKDEANNVVKIDIPTAGGELVDDLAYTDLVDVPILIADLDTITPTANTYYKHNGADETTYTNGVIYFYDGTAFKAITGGGAGGGITDVQVNGTSVVADGVANIPAASYTQAGVVTTGTQTFEGTKYFSQIGFIYGTNYSSPSAYVYVSSANKLYCKPQMCFGNGNNTVGGMNYTEVTQNGITFCTGSSYPTQYATSKSIDFYSGQTKKGSLRFDTDLVNGTFMVAPSTWSTGTSGTAKLPSAGLYEVKFDIYQIAYSTIINWDGALQTQASSIMLENGAYLKVGVDGAGFLDVWEGTIGGGEGPASISISYRKIGIA